MSNAEWATATASRFHVIAGRDELVSGSNDAATAEAVATSISAGRKAAVQVIDTARPHAYVRFFNGRKLETLGAFAA